MNCSAGGTTMTLLSVAIARSNTDVALTVKLGSCRASTVICTSFTVPSRWTTRVSRMSSPVALTTTHCPLAGATTITDAVSPARSVSLSTINCKPPV